MRESNLGVFERLQVYVNRQINGDRGKLGRVVAVTTGLLLTAAVDTTDASIDACVYSFDGRGDEIHEVAESIKFSPIDEILDSRPSVSFGDMHQEDN